MNHPNTPCPEHLKPVFTKVLAAIKAMLAGDVPKGIPPLSTRSKYICFTLRDMLREGQIDQSEFDAAKNFVEDCLRTPNDPEPSFRTWRQANDPVAADDRIIDICNAGRVAWLEFLTT